MRSMKMVASEASHSVASISQREVWEKVEKETSSEAVDDSSKYKEAMEQRMKRAISRNVEFPDSKIGFMAISEANELVGMELHRTPRIFKRRRETILISLEKEVKEGKKPVSEGYAEEKSREVLKKIASLDENQFQKQVEVDGLLLNLDQDTQGEYVSNRFYSSVCPNCGASKSRVALCNKCNFEEEGEEDFMYMNLK